MSSRMARRVVVSGDRRLIHGARSEGQRAKDLRRIRRRMQTHFGIRYLRDLSGEQRMHLEIFADAYRLVERLDVVDANGNATGNAATFNAALGHARSSLQAFVTSMGVATKQRDQDRTLSELAKYRRPAQ
jgi:hypothetical protein